jgi:5'-3' exoribonuclease 1
MCILHPENANILPKPIADKIFGPDSRLRKPVDYFPQTFTIDPFGAFWEHEFIAILPFVDEKLIHEVYDSVDFNLLTPEEKERD